MASGCDSGSAALGAIPATGGWLTGSPTGTAASSVAIATAGAALTGGNPAIDAPAVRAPLVRRAAPRCVRGAAREEKGGRCRAARLARERSRTTTTSAGRARRSWRPNSP
eukprot:4629526-Prymnesium_polylepis.1